MRRFLTCLALIATLVTFARAQVGVTSFQRVGPPLTSERELYFRLGFDQEVAPFANLSAFQLVTTLGMPVLAGAGNHAVDLSASTDHRIANTSVTGFPTQAFTVELWVKTTDGAGTLVSYATGPASLQEIRISDPSSLDVYVADVQIISAGPAVDDGLWHHVAVTWSSATGDVQLYVDGGTPVLGNGAQGVTLGSSGSLSLMQGQSAVGVYNTRVDGEVDEFRVWKQVRSAAALNANRHRPLGEAALPAMAVYWPLETVENLGIDGGGLDDVRDLTDNGNHGDCSPGAFAFTTDHGLSEEWALVRVSTLGANCNAPVSVEVSGTVDLAAGGTATVATTPSEEYFFFSPSPGNTAVSVISVSPDPVLCPLQVVQITGTGFNGGSVDTVWFDGIPSPAVTVLTNGLLEAVVPASVPVGIPLDVTAFGSCSNAGILAGAVTVSSAIGVPTITSITPTVGPCDGGNNVDIFGTGFMINGVAAVDQVLFGGVPGTTLGVNSDTHVKIKAPVGLPVGVTVPIEISGPCIVTTVLPAAYTPREVFHVPGDFPTIAAALAQACDDSIIEVAPGTHVTNNVSFGGVGATVISAMGPEVTELVTSNGGRHMRPSAGARIQGFTFRNGFTTGIGGGAIWIDDPDTALIVIRDCVFEGNGTLKEGGAIMVDAGNVRIADCTFRDNTAASGGALALRDTGGAPEVEAASVRFVGNAVTGAGGAVQVQAGGTLAMTHVTALGNLCPSGPGAFSIGGTLSLGNAVVWENDHAGSDPSDQIDGPGAITVHDSAIEGGFPGVANIAADPLFRDTDGRLFRFSPCVDAAGPTDGIALTGVDVDGCPRNSGPARDMGASEVVVPAYPGTNEDFELRVAIDGELEAVCDVGQPRDVFPADDVAMLMVSQLGTFVGAPPILVGQLFTTGAAPTSSFPGLHLGLAVTPEPFILFDGQATAGVFGPLGLPAHGLELIGTAPFVTAGFSIMLQAIVPSPAAANGIIAISDGVELRFP